MKKDCFVGLDTLFWWLHAGFRDAARATKENAAERLVKTKQYTDSIIARQHGITPVSVWQNQFMLKDGICHIMMHHTKLMATYTYNFFRG
ncbi:hypothetical protein ABVN80_08330 [Acinetobacter baumannii]